MYIGTAESAEEDMANNPISQVQLHILRVVQDIGDPLLEHISNRLHLSKEEVRGPLRDLLNRGAVRMKEDPYDHDWAYVLTRTGKQILAGFAFSLPADSATSA